MRFVILTPKKRAIFAPLLAAARAGDKDALAEAVHLVEEPLRRCIRERISSELQSKFDSVDAMQATYIDALTAFKDFHDDTADEFVAWLMEIAMHNCQDLVRYFQRGRRNVDREEPTQADTSSEAKSIISTRAEEPALSEAERECKRRLKRLMRALPTNERALLRARFWQRLSYRQIAERLGRSPDAVRKRCGRLISKLRKQARIYLR